jgi:hypothetical protein
MIRIGQNFVKQYNDLSIFKVRDGKKDISKTFINVSD